MRLADVVVPDTSTARLALEVLERHSAPALVNHCRRSYLLAASLAQIDGVDVDHEVLWVAAILHDLGLEDPFDSHRLPFEQAGGRVAWVFAAGAGWPEIRRDQVSAAIVAHMVGTDPAVDPEGHLLDLATGLDISGKRAERWPAPLLTELVAAFPRLDLAERFTACIEDQAARKPTSAAADAVRGGIASRFATNPLDALI